MVVREGDFFFFLGGIPHNSTAHRFNPVFYRARPARTQVRLNDEGEDLVRRVVLRAQGCDVVAFMSWPQLGMRCVAIPSQAWCQPAAAVLFLLWPMAAGATKLDSGVSPKACISP